MKVRGYRIELGEVEAAIRKHSDVSDCVVVAREDVVGEKQLIAYVVSQAETTDTHLNGSELRRYLKGTLPEYMVPSLFVQLSSLPLTPNGKVDRRALPAPDAERPHLEREYVGARTELEGLLVEFWEQSLGVERIGIHDNFFELGGDSIKGAVLINRLQQWLGEYVYVVALFDAPTVAELASYFNTHYAEAVARVCPAALIPDAGQKEGSGEEEIERVRKLIVPLPAPLIAVRRTLSLSSFSPLHARAPPCCASCSAAIHDSSLLRSWNCSASTRWPSGAMPSQGATPSGSKALCAP